MLMVTLRRGDATDTVQLGGTGSEEDGRYVLGDDALACLRDLKRWLKIYDEKLNRLDVARCLAEANLVNGDLLPILASWKEDVGEDKSKARIALAALELLVPLTWPLETGAAMTVNHHRHTPYLQQAQVLYKAGILGNDTATILRTIVRVGLPSIAMARSDRSQRDHGIIKLMLYVLRNIASISLVANIPTQGLENEVSRSATIEAFRFQDVFALILTMCSNMGDDFDQEDVIILDILFHLIRGIEAEKLFMTEEKQKVQLTNDLKDILSKERSMQRDYAKIAPTRHGRFGTMIWVKREDDKLSAVSGQDTFRDGQHTLMKMDKSKKFNKPKQKKKDEEHTIYDFDHPVRVSHNAGESLRMFTEEFLDSGFNPLFTHLRKAIEREADRIQEVNVRQYFYVTSWFLKAERARREYQKILHAKSRLGTEFEVDSYSLVAGVLNQETFVLLNKEMQKAFDNKEWPDLNASMRFFTQILLTVQDMALSPLEEDQEIAENIQNRIFYEESTHDRVISILKGYKDQGFGYLDASTELSHNFLRMLERYSKENVDLQIRSRRTARRKKRAEKKAADEAEDVNDDERSENEDALDSVQISKERKFDFGRFAVKFTSQKSVDTYVALLAYYRDLSSEQLKRAHRFFYRIAFKQDFAVLLYRMDIVALLHKLIKGPEGLPTAHKMFKEWEEFTKQLFKKMFKKISERPELITELLFSKINATLYYLEFGHEKQTRGSARTTTELEVKGSARTIDEKIGIAIGALEADKKMHYVHWIRRSLELAISERKSWEGEAAARKELTESTETTRPEEGGIEESKDSTISTIPSYCESRRSGCLQMLTLSLVVKPRDDNDISESNRNAKLRLLMSLVGLEKTDSADGKLSWTIPAKVSSDELALSLALMEKHMLNPPTEVDGYEASELLRRVTTHEYEEQGFDADTTIPGFIDDSEGSDAEAEFMFPDNIRLLSNPGEPNEPKKRKLVRRKKNVEIGEGVQNERRKAREDAALERRKAIKSALYINESDDETDEERDKAFFEQEAKRRAKQASSVLKALTSEQQNSERKKRKSTRDESVKRKKRRAAKDSDDENGTSTGASDEEPIAAEKDSDSDATFPKETPISSQVQDSDDEIFLRKESSVRKGSVELAITQAEKATAAAEESDEDVVAIAPRRRVRAGFVMDSDDE